jgi:hypothetical protein
VVVASVLIVGFVGSGLFGGRRKCSNPKANKKIKRRWRFETKCQTRSNMRGNHKGTANQAKRLWV